MKKLFLFFFLTSFYSFSQDSLQVQKPKISVIELDKIKVVYRGIENPITIAVPKNVKSFTVSGNGVIPTNEIGKFIAIPGVGNEMIIKVEMTLLDDSIIVEEHVYQIKGLPVLIGSLNKEFSTQGFLNFSKEDLKDAEVGIKMVDFLFNIQIKTTSFLISCNGKKIKVDGNKFNEEANKFIKKIKKNSLIIISDIKYPTSVNATPKRVQPIIIKIID